MPGAEPLCGRGLVGREITFKTSSPGATTPRQIDVNAPQRLQRDHLHNASTCIAIDAARSGDHCVRSCDSRSSVAHIRRDAEAERCRQDGVSGCVRVHHRRRSRRDHLDPGSSAASSPVAIGQRRQRPRKRRLPNDRAMHRGRQRRGRGDLRCPTSPGVPPASVTVSDGRSLTSCGVPVARPQCTAVDSGGSEVTLDATSSATPTPVSVGTVASA